MSQSSQSDVQRLHHELDRYRAIVHQCKDKLEDQPWLDKQISFWMESTRFLITELEVWERLRDNAKYYRTVHKVQKAMYQLDKLILQLTSES